MPGHCWTRTVTRPSFPKPDARALLSTLGGEPWTDQDLPQMTDVLWTRGRHVKQQVAAVVKAVAEVDAAAAAEEEQRGGVADGAAGARA